MTLAVSALHVYPIKACRGIAVDEAVITSRGFAGDRRWMIVDGGGTFVTQRTLPQLTLVRTAIDAGTLRLSAPERKTIELPLAHEGGDAIEVEVWGHRGVAIRHPTGSAWFAEFLGAPHHLVYMPDRHRRRVDPDYAHPTDVVSFADAFPFLLISEASLSDLNRRLREPITMERFRPNIVVTGAAAFAEDVWQHLTIGGVPFRGPKPCARCTVPTVDPETGARGAEPLTTLAEFRKTRGKILFGMNLIHDALGTLRVGDAVTVQP